MKTDSACQSNAASATTDNAQTDKEPDSPDTAAEFKYLLESDADPEEVENLRGYRPGGYHPVALGDVLGDRGRFRVVHKLGFGGYATVWLCHDDVSKKWRALKIMMASNSTPDCADLKAIELFKDVDTETLAANHIQLPLDHFWIDGPNGRHLCFVLPLLGPNLGYLYNYYAQATELMKDICFQLVEALMFIHSRGLCHGDFRTDNILLRLLDGIDELEEDAMIGLLDEPFITRVHHVDGPQAQHEPGVPTYLVERTEMIYGSGFCAAKIAVIDFGVSYHVSQAPVKKGTGIPMPYSAPEELLEFGTSLGFPTDIWALGVTIAKVRCGFTPFACDSDTFLDALEKMESVMGPMPEPFRTRWKDWDGVFVNCQDKDGNFTDDQSWKDETVHATLNTEEHEYTAKDRIREGRSPNHLLYRLQHGLIMMCVDHELAADIASQAASDPSRLPTYPWGDDAREIEYEDKPRHPMSDSEVGQIFDLFLTMFKWNPEKRASLDQIANHEWFGDRNRRRLLAKPSNNNKRARSPSPPRPGKRSRSEEEKGVASFGNILAHVWGSWGSYRAQTTRAFRRGVGNPLPHVWGSWCSYRARITRVFKRGVGRMARSISRLFRRWNRRDLLPR